MNRLCYRYQNYLRTVVVVFLSILISSCGTTKQTITEKIQSPEQIAVDAFKSVIPKPVEAELKDGFFILNQSAQIKYEPSSEELEKIGKYLADSHRSTGFNLNVTSGKGTNSGGTILIEIDTTNSALGDEGYKLTVYNNSVVITAQKPAGLFYGVQTLRQLFPAEIDAQTVQTGPWEIACGTITDYPRYGWRGTMLDVARHFFKVEDVKKYIDILSYYKLNRFHMHLSDDQGWRIMINSWPNLALHGGKTSVNGDGGGYYAQAEYSDIIKYAQDRYITVIPEIDMPGHTNAALSSYPELNCSGVAPDLYEGIDVGFSSLCIKNQITYKFIDDVIKELADLTPGKYIHIGGDEAKSTKEDEYKEIVQRLQYIVHSHGKEIVGWGEIAQIKLSKGSVAQSWDGTVAAGAAAQGAKVLMSPASRAYLDMKYDSTQKLGLNWAGFTSVEKSYSWEPDTMLAGVSGESIVGVEAPIWSETLVKLSDLEYMAFPRMPGIGEIGWSPKNGRNWDEYKKRLALQGERFKFLGINYYQSPDVPWGR